MDERGDAQQVAGPRNSYCGQSGDSLLWGFEQIGNFLMLKPLPRPCSGDRASLSAALERSIPYAGPVEGLEVGEFLERFAPDDVKATVAWLADNGYSLVSQRGEGTFGAQFVYAGDAEVQISVDRSQWFLDVAPRPGAKAWQYDLLVVARAGRPYGEVFPDPGSRSTGDPLPEQLPDGVSWHDTLPDILKYVDGQRVQAAVDGALRERDRLMWPRTRRR